MQQEWLVFDIESRDPTKRPPQGEQILLWFEAHGEYPAHAVAGYVYGGVIRLDVVVPNGDGRTVIEFHGGAGPTHWQALTGPDKNLTDQTVLIGR